MSIMKHDIEAIETIKKHLSETEINEILRSKTNGERLVDVWHKRLAGKAYKAIGEDWHVSDNRALQLFCKSKRILNYYVKARLDGKW